MFIETCINTGLVKFVVIYFINSSLLIIIKDTQYILIQQLHYNRDNKLSLSAQKGQKVENQTVLERYWAMVNSDMNYQL